MIGTWLGKHQLLHRLAVGGMAEIYLARATGIEQFEKLLVLKRMLPRYAADHRFIRMFLDEARLAATFSHPNIAHVYDIGGSDGHYYFTMEYVHGEDLAAILSASRAAGTRVPLEHALTVVTGVAAGLHAAHDKRGADGAVLGVVHRDVSPSNVLVGYDGSVKVVDFGIARVASPHKRPLTGGFMGKARYSSPEQIRGESLDRRSDIFSLGIMLFELTTGTRPFDGDDDAAVMQAIVAGAPPSPAGPDYPVALKDIVLRALHRDRSARFATAQELQLALEELARQRHLSLSSAMLSSYMSELFGGKIAAWHEARRAGRSLTEHVIATATGGTIDLAAEGAPALASPRRPAALAVRSVSRRGWQRGLVIAVLGAIAGIGYALAPVANPVRIPADSAAAATMRVDADASAPRELARANDSRGSNPASDPVPSVTARAAVPAPDAPRAPGDRAIAIGSRAPAPTPSPAALPRQAPAPARVLSTPARAQGGDGKRSTGVRRQRATPASEPALRTQSWDPDSPLEP
jgi:tRNA A-37 threonylcarbamoyl transferase component Bud32